ncbi:hypothetical protein [Flavisolibacter ginsenosidimutans]|uniref:Uncharacterized protein n=1 Tax=Flavisolibacter ginsenosidimutans TaxID=661481 RepID=A0A5B8UG49_9BACT|nr:hypothetical protein [Flavisolibacter ginsenosidimutans]QEC55286.1 hypothetical protein FSB75_04980 [Flavisolibacter ginsenosidimutans]
MRESIRSTEKIYTRKEAADMLKGKERDIHLLREDLKQAYNDILLLTKEVQALKEKIQTHENPDDGYRKEWTWVKKIVFVLEQAGKPLRSPEIIEVLAKREEHLRNHWNQAQYFSAFLDMALKAERIKREKRKGERGFYYFLT